MKEIFENIWDAPKEEVISYIDNLVLGALAAIVVTVVVTLVVTAIGIFIIENKWRIGK